MLPAEWEKQAAVWLTWPQNQETWGAIGKDAEVAYREIVRAALRFQDVILLVDDAALGRRLQTELSPGARHKLETAVCPTNDSWTRDYGALTARAGGELVTLDFTFNSWGGKYPPWDKDDAVPRFMAERRERRAVEVDFVLEGGSIDVNGRGAMLTTRECLLNPNRNPKLAQGEIEEALRLWLGATDVIWLDAGIHGDDTDGHVDDLARFSDPRTVLCAVESDARDENYAALKANFASLNRHARGASLEAVEMPMPARQVKEGLRTPATYLNFLILNGAVLAPVFRDKRDDDALQIFEKHFPGREIVPIDCRALVFGQGAIHCSSMQEPEE